MLSIFKNKKEDQKKIVKKDNDKDQNVFDKGQDWEASKIESLHKSLKISWIFTLLFAFTTVVSIVAVSALTPLKTVQLELIKVDSSTGIVEVMEQQKEFKTNYDETINTYFVKQYVRFRESYSYPLMSDYYSNVSLMSTGQEQQIYAKWFNPNNPESPLNVYGQKKVGIIKFKSVTYLDDDIALVRFIRFVNQANDTLREEHLTATVRFKYVKGAISNLNKEINPLGFQVVEYRIDEESVK